MAQMKQIKNSETAARLTSLFTAQGINVHLAKKMIEDRSRDYMNARRVAKVRPHIKSTIH